MAARNRLPPWHEQIRLSNGREVLIRPIRPADADPLRQGFACWQGRAEVGVIAGHVPHGLGALFGHFEADHDGTVAVAETRLEGLADHVVIAASHSGLLFSAEAASQAAAFLRDGHFMPVAAGH